MVYRNSKNFVSSEKVLNVINMASTWKKRPSEILNIEEEYDAYCFDEACTYILNKLKDDKKPHWVQDKHDKGNNPGLRLLMG